MEQCSWGVNKQSSGAGLDVKGNRNRCTREGEEERDIFFVFMVPVNRVTVNKQQFWQ